MINRTSFFEVIRASVFAGKMTQSQVDGINAILDEWERNHAGKDPRWLAYMLATTHHETDKTMQPIEEYSKGAKKGYGRRVKFSGKPYSDTSNLFYGRGFVQLTWYENYQKAGVKLGLDLIHLPEVALTLSVATRILLAGMMEGWFTGKKLGDYFSAKKEDWVNARRIINGTDKADLIASYGKCYLQAILPVA